MRIGLLGRSARVDKRPVDCPDIDILLAQSHVLGGIGCVVATQKPIRRVRISAEAVRNRPQKPTLVPLAIAAAVLRSVSITTSSFDPERHRITWPALTRLSRSTVTIAIQEKSPATRGEKFGACSNEDAQLLGARTLMFTAMAISTILVTANILVHYELLRLMSVYVPSLPIAVRLKVLTVVLGCFVAHTIEVWLYAGAFLLIHEAGLGSLKGQVEEHFADFLYFSATSYSTMGIGDVYPTGALRLVSGIEGINGLFLVAWSTSFTYFVMDRLWPLHPDQGAK